jgi:FtsZ-interacting cell division protein ZipA
MTGAVAAVIVIVLLVVVVAAVLFVGNQQKKRRQLRERFGPEYDRRVEAADDPKKAERELAELAHQRDKLDITPLDAATRERYLVAWNQVQAQFVDQPAAALESADTLVNQVMRDRGYPVQDDFDQRSDLVAVDHPDVVNHYRAASETRRRTDEVSTEDQRVAFVHYRDLFSELLDDTEAADARRAAHVEDRERVREGESR